MSFLFKNCHSCHAFAARFNAFNNLQDKTVSVILKTAVMARQSKGILNEFSGKIGTVVGSSWNGIQYIRSLPARSKKQQPSILQLERQARFALGMRFIQSMGELTTRCFTGATGKTAKNEALSRLLSQAISGTYPNLTLDYSQIEIARGQLKKAEQVTVLPVAPGKVRFNWHNNTGTGNASANDRAVLVACAAETMDIIYSLDACSRVEGTGLLDLRFFSCKPVHTWLSFCRADGSLSADSVYAGQLLVG